MNNIDQLPPSLRPIAERHWQAFREAATGEGITDDALDGLPEELPRVWAMSDFVAQHCVRRPGLLMDLVHSGDLAGAYREGTYAVRLAAALEEVGDEGQLGGALRRFRRREMVRIAWRDLARQADLAQTVADLSELADACIGQALEHLYRWHCDQWGTPCNAAGASQHPVVLGMGKLGGRELNFSSDVDLIFAFPEDGETRDGRRTVSNQEFFVRLCQRLVNALAQPTAEGFVFRVDTRLRPFGASSALALSFDAMEDYYQVHGREWERYAMIKARVVAGDREAGQRLLALLRPFVYRRYVDFGVFESLREMKAMIEQEVRRKGMEDNVKLGAGGIREVEFIGQALQLIRGGREPTLQTRRILTALEALRGFGWLPDYVVGDLVAAYGFLRDTEHRLQMFADQQTHNLPEDPVQRERIAFAMGFDGWPGFEAALRAHMRRVHGHFEQVFVAPQTEAPAGEAVGLAAAWLGMEDEVRAVSALGEAGFSRPEEAVRLLQQMRGGYGYRAQSAQGRARLDRLMPLLLGAVGQGNDPDSTLPRVLHLVEAVARRPAYLALLVENPMALSQLVKLCGASSWVAALLAKYPLLLDELLDPRTLYAPPGRDELKNDLHQRLLRIPGDDLEQQMDALRHFKQANLLRVGAADVVGAVPLMVVSDHLTDLAEVVIDAVLELAWHHLTARHGRPPCEGCDTGFAIVGYGKLGGIELGYGSDLDLVFLHGGQAAGAVTDGAKPVDAAVFYARLVQRIIHLLATQTRAGVLYEVDTRLRPSGASGLLVSNLDAFAEYQRNQAWTWEHQALVRARGITGDPAVIDRFNGIRREVLVRPRELPVLREEVREMRQRMRTGLSKSGAGGFDLKQDPGGIADIEFMVQYGVLAWAHEHPALLDYTDNIRLLEGLARSGLMPGAEAALLADAYRAYRARLHRLTLQDRPAVVDDSEFPAYREAVLRTWRWMLEEEG